MPRPLDVDVAAGHEQQEAAIRAIALVRDSGFVAYAQEFLKIRTKAGDIVPFQLNSMQLELDRIAEEQLEKNGMVRLIVLKARQMGCSTYIEGRFYYKTSGDTGKQAFILTHEDKATNNLFDMTKRFHDKMDPRFKPHTKKSNAKELVFDRLDSSYGVGTAKTGATGRSLTIQFFHGSEVAFWQDAQGIATGVLQAVGMMPGTEIWLESTARGMGNYFHRITVNARKEIGEFRFIFEPWFVDPQYQMPTRQNLELTASDFKYQAAFNLSDEQMSWRATKIEQFGGGDQGRVRFMQEYPATPEEAFTKDEIKSLIKSIDVMRARSATEIEAIGPEIIGVDPAWKGKNRTAVWSRTGSVANRIARWSRLDTMETAGRLGHILTLRPNATMMIDVIGIGAGVYDRLCELEYGDRIIPVYAGDAPDDDSKFTNKRAEMWGRIDEWLTNKPQVSLPDDDGIQADLTSVNRKNDSKYRLKMESKDEMKDRGEPSPDDGDALGLTFAYEMSANAGSHSLDPDRPYNWRTP